MNKEMKIIYKQNLTGKIALVVGTRPGIVMFAPIIHRLREQGIPHFVIHTGQHYSPNMDSQFFDDLNLPEPEHKLEGVGEKKTHGGQTGAMLEGIERILLDERPGIVLVGGDANTNLAGALAARKLGIAVGHIEAGERSFDWRMPEEHNRRIIDHISDYLFATGEKAKKHLVNESVQGIIHVVGNPIVDASLQHIEIAKKKTNILNEFDAKPGKYAVLTTHREENVDYAENLEGILSGVSMASRELELPVIFLAHPRTLKNLKGFSLREWADKLDGLFIHEAVGYLEFLYLLANSRLAFTDSGGVQQEAYIHKVPAVTLRENTEWEETLDMGANRLAGTDKHRILEAAREAYSVNCEWTLPFGEGKAAENIANICERWVEE